MSQSNSATHLDSGVTDYPTSRFAVAAFDTWDGVHTSIGDLRSGGTKIQDLNCLGFHRVLAADFGLRAMHQSLQLQPLPFQNNRELISCTCGPVADRLA